MHLKSVKQITFKFSFNSEKSTPLLKKFLWFRSEALFLQAWFNSRPLWKYLCNRMLNWKCHSKKLLPLHNPKRPIYTLSYLTQTTPIVPMFPVSETVKLRAVSVTRDTREKDGVKHECYPLILPHLNQNVIKKIHPYAALEQLILFWVG